LIETDREKLRLVLQNILDNAATYADEGTCIRVAVTDQEGMRVLRVSNSASHLSTEAVPNVFDRFWRADSSCRGAEAHCGLGLPLCKAMIEKLGGTIDATLSADATFTITVCLPGATSTRRTQGVPS
jgi:signal transduction histidine kinase